MKKTILILVLLIASFSLIYADSVSATYTAADIPTTYNSYDPACSGAAHPLTVTIAGSYTVTSVDVVYNTSGTSWTSERFSRLACATSGTDEGTYYSNASNYSRTGLTFANGDYSTNLVFEMWAYRTYYGPGCTTDKLKINNNSWTVTVHYDADDPVPVNLSSFYALYIGGTPSVYWTTETETDNAYWNVYRGVSGNFEAAALLNANNPVPGNGTTNDLSEYVYEDSAPVIPNTTYWYWIEDVSLDGVTEVHEPISLSIPSEDTPVTPVYGLLQNYPNPFNPSTTISFTLQGDSDVELIIYNVKGEKIKSIFTDHIDADQTITTVWNGDDATGKQVSSGVYYYKLITNTQVYQKKMLLVK